MGDLLVEGSAANRLVTESISACRATNIMSELRFSRILKHLISSVFARAANASTMASKHVLAEFASMHSRAATAWEEAEAIPAADIRFFTPNASSGWHLYLADQRALGINMAEIGSTWHNLTADEKDDYNKQADKKAKEDSLVENLRTAMPSDRTPLGLGNKQCK